MATPGNAAHGGGLHLHPGQPVSGPERRPSAAIVRHEKKTLSGPGLCLAEAQGRGGTSRAGPARQHPSGVSRRAEGQLFGTAEVCAAGSLRRGIRQQQRCQNGQKREEGIQASRKHDFISLLIKVFTLITSKQSYTIQEKL
jgi:hypothetical protein